MADVWSNDPDRTTRRGDTRTDAEIIRQAYVTGVPCCSDRDKGWHTLDCHNAPEAVTKHLRRIFPV